MNDIGKYLKANEPPPPGEGLPRAPHRASDVGPVESESEGGPATPSVTLVYGPQGAGKTTAMVKINEVRPQVRVFDTDEIGRGIDPGWWREAVWAEPPSDEKRERWDKIEAGVREAIRTLLPGSIIFTNVGPIALDPPREADVLFFGLNPGESTSEYIGRFEGRSKAPTAEMAQQWIDGHRTGVEKARSTPGVKYVELEKGGHISDHLSEILAGRT